MTWYGLNWGDILLNTAVLAFVPLLLAAWGGHLAAEAITDPKKKRGVKLCFWGLFVFGVAATAWQQFRAAENDFEKDINNKFAWAIVGRKEFPAPPVPKIEQVLPSTPRPQANLVFTFPVGVNVPLQKEITAQLNDGIVNLDFTAENNGTTDATDGQIWVQICDECRFAEEPFGSTMPDGDLTVRRKVFTVLHRGVFFDATHLRIRPSPNLASFTIAFKYACKECALLDNAKPQKLLVHVLKPQ
ncbi:MAG: hypothetical protein WCC26_03740 [Terracidiphilus sp.]